MPEVSVDDVLAALRSGTWATADLVRLHHGVATFGNNRTSVLGQYGEELVAKAFGGTVASFDQKAFDVRTPDHGDLQVKTFSVGKRAGAIRSLTHDVVTLAIDPATAKVVSAKLYRADDLFEVFKAKYDAKHAWGGNQADRFERGWTISTRVPSTDITAMFADL